MLLNIRMTYLEVYIGKIVTQLYQLDNVTKRDVKKAYKNTHYYVDINDKVTKEYETYLITNNINCEMDDGFIKQCIKHSRLTQHNIKRTLYKTTHKILIRLMNERVEVDGEQIQIKYVDVYKNVLKEISQIAHKQMNELSKDLLL